MRKKPLPLLKHPKADGQFKRSMLNIDHWAAEIKYDGSRAYVYFENGKTRLVMRSGIVRYSVAIPYVKSLEGTILDTEIYDPAGFAATMSAIMTDKKQANNLQVAVFDIPYYQGRDVRLETLSERRKLIAEVIKVLRAKHIHIVAQVIKDKEAFFLHQTTQLGAEGIILKHLSRPYGLDWIKVKAFRETSVIVLANNPEHFQSYSIGILENSAMCNLGHIKIPDYALRSIKPYQTIIDMKALGIYAQNGEYRFREPSVIRLRPDLTVRDCSLNKIISDMGKAIYTT